MAINLASAGIYERANPDTTLSHAEVIELCSLARALRKGMDIADAVDDKHVEDKVFPVKPIPDVVRCPYGRRHFQQKGYTSFAIASDGRTLILEVSDKIHNNTNYFIKHNDKWQFVRSAPTWEF